MAFSIKNPEADRLARRLADITGESLTEAVAIALRERMQRQDSLPKRRYAGDELTRIAKKLAKLPVLKTRTPDEILGYDNQGLPT